MLPDPDGAVPQLFSIRFSPGSPSGERDVASMEGNKVLSKREGRRSLTASIKRRQGEVRFPVISEIKVRSDKEGDLLRGRDPVRLAKEMARLPVAGISVVTEPEHFGGHMDLLRAIAAAVDVPVLHKDFITSARQIRESADCGASAVLLIAAMLGTEQLICLVDEARSQGLETLVEVHTIEEMGKMACLEFDLMGINNRDITIYETDDGNVDRTETLAAACRRDRPLISESSIHHAGEVRRVGRSGADAVLIGTAVLKSECMAGFLSELIGVGWPV